MEIPICGRTAGWSRGGTQTWLPERCSLTLLLPLCFTSFRKASGTISAKWGSYRVHPWGYFVMSLCTKTPGRTYLIQGQTSTVSHRNRIWGQFCSPNTLIDKELIPEKEPGRPTGPCLSRDTSCSGLMVGKKQHRRRGDQRYQDG